ncbi:MAG: Athe_2463 domain-containing protein [Bacillota bacterium]
MFKRLSAITVVFFLLTAFLIKDFAEAGVPFDADSAINNALQNSGGYYWKKAEDGKSIRYVITKSFVSRDSEYDYGFLTYGEPYGEERDGQHRYIGYTKDGEDYTNLDFPPDKNAEGADFGSRIWIEKPWKDPRVKATNSRIVKFKGDGDPKYHGQLLWGIGLFEAGLAANGYTVGKISDNLEFWKNIEQYVHILAPPTKYAWGIGRMWHIKDGGLWYVTVPILPEIMVPKTPDLATHLETDKFIDVQPGRKITSTVAYSLNQDHPNPERAWLRLHHAVDGQEFPIQLAPVNGAPAPDKDGHIILQPGGVKIYSYTFTVQDRPTKILSRIDPADAMKDKNWENNRAEADVKINGYDIKIKITPERQSYKAVNGEPALLSFKVRVTRKDDIPGLINITGANKTRVDSKSFNIKLGPGEYINIPYSFKGGPGSYTIDSEAWPSGVSDIHPPDNVDRVTVNVGNEEFKSDKRIHSEILDGGPQYRY